MDEDAGDNGKSAVGDDGKTTAGDEVKTQGFSDYVVTHSLTLACSDYVVTHSLRQILLEVSESEHLFFLWFWHGPSM